MCVVTIKSDLRCALTLLLSFVWLKLFMLLSIICHVLSVNIQLYSLVFPLLPRSNTLTETMPHLTFFRCTVFLTLLKPSVTMGEILNMCESQSAKHGYPESHDFLSLSCRQNHISSCWHVLIQVDVSTHTVVCVKMDF